jgi:membrane-bound lytic murein transglycosylase A
MRSRNCLQKIAITSSFAKRLVESAGTIGGLLASFALPEIARAAGELPGDPRFIPLGAPVYVATTWPLSDRPLNRLMLAQDTGGAIRGPVRADWFWGFGEDAAQQAGRMKQEGMLWLLWPKGTPLPH